MNIGKRIIELREAKGWSQYRLYKEANIGQSTLSRIEANKKVPNTATLRKIASALGVSMAEFDEHDALAQRFSFMFKDDNNKPSALHALGLAEAEAMPKTDKEKAALERLKAMPTDEQQRRIFEKYKSLSPEQRKAIDVIIQSLAPSQQ